MNIIKFNKYFSLCNEFSRTAKMLNLTYPLYQSITQSSINSINSQEAFKRFSERESEKRKIAKEMELAYMEACKWPLKCAQKYFLSSFEDTKSLANYAVDKMRDNNGFHLEYDVWSELKVLREQVDEWKCKLRNYLVQTILVRLFKEINDINEFLLSAGYENTRVGQSSISTLKHLTATHSHILPTLSSLIPFLEVYEEQKYVVQRIKELCSGGYMSSFRWSSGGDFEGEKWKKCFPTDSALIMHFFCTYMDSILPVHASYLTKGEFTSDFFFREIENTKLTKMKKSVHIVEMSANPPNYAIYTEGKLLRLKSGRTNLFESILLFFYILNIKEGGMLDRINLGPSGINILWIFEDN